jgi:hypothetical protein
VYLLIDSPGKHRIQALSEKLRTLNEFAVDNRKVYPFSFLKLPSKRDCRLNKK